MTQETVTIVELCNATNHIDHGKPISECNACAIEMNQLVGKNHPEWEKGYTKGFVDGRRLDAEDLEYTKGFVDGRRLDAEDLESMAETMVVARDATVDLIATWIARGRIDEPLRSMLAEQIRRGDWIIKT